ncbi:MAG TPA: DUF4012 domain-containing protein [Actinomycetota bacterium]|nr:DUF4012 domain-containing protein [Actinomycetota bacterium]
MNSRHYVAIWATALTVVGVGLWISMLAAPLTLVGGLTDARTQLNAADRLVAKTQIKAAGRAARAGLEAAEAAQGVLDGPSPLLDIARLHPVAGPALEEVPHLIAAALYSAEAAVGTIDIAQNVLRGPDAVMAEDPNDPDGGSLIRIDRIRAIGDAIREARELLGYAEDELGSIDLDNLPRKMHRPIARAIEKAIESRRVLGEAQAGFEVLPSFLGETEPRTYLIGMQNPAEQRGTGGAILQFALLSITEGKPTLPETRGSVYKVDEDRQQISIPLPDDAWYLEGIPDARRFGNSNWSPHWPLSAQLMLDYAHASDENFPDIDGVLAVDPVLMEKLLPGIGKYKTEESGNRITTKRVVHFVLYKAYASFPIPQQRRRVLRQVVDGFYEGMLAPGHPTLLIQGFADALEGKHMQIWMRDPAEQAFVEAMDWDGGIKEAARSDYLYIVEQNVGGNKLDYLSAQTNRMDIAFDGDDAVVSTEVEIENRLFLPQPRWALGDSGTAGHHLPMTNVYVPSSARLTSFDVEGERLDTPLPAVWANDAPAEHLEVGKKVWSATLDIPPGSSGSVRYDYVVPDVVRTLEGRRVYRLVVQHQPNVHAEQLVVTIEVPPGAKSVRAPGFEKDGATVVWDKPASKDLVLEVSWER